ncbi:HipA domain-containing protein [Ilumatobacter sp.]|uniref:HipA domain-containing protein n=1 Tax=Ilumatobacter sp. TaxID=1967498 RepID=UPI003B52F387
MSNAGFPDVDIGAWQIEHVEALGRKRKMWLLDPDGDAWLFKQTTENRHSDGTRYWKGDDWAEVVVSAVASEMGIPTPTYRLAHLNESGSSSRGVISRKMVNDDESLIEGNILLEEVGVRAAGVRDRTGYTLQNVRRSLQEVAPPVGNSRMTSWDWFVGFVVLDALVGNTDRHQQNWAVIQASTRRLAPTFDHASSLGFLLDDQTRLDRLRTEDAGFSVGTYAAKASSKFDGNPSTLAIAESALEMVGPTVRDHWIGHVEAVQSLDPILAEVPPSRISPAAASFAAAVFRANRTQLCDTP